MSYHMFLDDERSPIDVTWVSIPPDVDWVIVRSFDDAVRCIRQNGWPYHISFDHDLGHTDGKTGYDLVHWIIGHSMDNVQLPVDFTFTVHSKNPVGSKNITMKMNNFLGHIRNHE